MDVPSSTSPGAVPRQIGRAPPPPSPPSRLKPVVIGAVVVVIAVGAWFLGRSSTSDMPHQQVQPAATPQSQPPVTAPAETATTVATEGTADPDLASWPKDKAPMSGIPKLAQGRWRGLLGSEDGGKTNEDLKLALLCIAEDQQIKIIGSGKVLTIEKVISINGDQGKGFIMSFVGEPRMLWFVSLTEVADTYLVQQMEKQQGDPIREHTRFVVVNKH